MTARPAVLPCRAGECPAEPLDGGEDCLPGVDPGVPLGRLEGHLDLLCVADAAGRSRLVRQSARAPFHVGKSYWNGHALVAQVVNPTAGLFAGDTLRCEVRVEPGARLHLTTPAAGRIHTMPAGRAVLDQDYAVARGAWLEWQPSLLIPQRGCRYRQATRVHVEDGGEIFFMESLAPGRVARGEWFQFTEIDWEWDLHYGRRLVARERFFLRQGDLSLAPLTRPFPRGYYASGCLVAGATAVPEDCWRAVRGLNCADALVGVSRLAGAVWSIKLLARDSPALDGALKSLRGILSTAVPWLRSDPRKI